MIKSCKDCQECDLSRMGIGDKPQCTKQQAEKCDDCIKHLCRFCVNMATCRYILDIPKKDVKQYGFVKKTLPTSKGGTIVCECSNYHFVQNKPRGNKKKTEKLYNDLEDFALIERQKDYTAFI